MPEIIPNFHPIFVHFTVALFSLAVGLFVVTPFMKKSPLKEQWYTVARWALWFGAGFTVLTGATGLYAYNTVAHDTPSHAAMTEHRNWAIVTITLLLTLAIGSAVRIRRNMGLGMLFVGLMVVAGGLLASTAWHGGEVVYRYGLGVMSLPKTDSHKHGAGEQHGHGAAPSPGMNSGHPDEDHDHDDEHSHSDDDPHLDSTLEMNVGVGSNSEEAHTHNDGEYAH